jgi:hypothetical protein
MEEDGTYVELCDHTINNDNEQIFRAPLLVDDYFHPHILDTDAVLNLIEPERREYTSTHADVFPNEDLLQESRDRLRRGHSSLEDSSRSDSSRTSLVLFEHDSRNINQILVERRDGLRNAKLKNDDTLKLFLALKLIHVSLTFVDVYEFFLACASQDDPLTSIVEYFEEEGLDAQHLLGDSLYQISNFVIHYSAHFEAAKAFAERNSEEITHKKLFKQIDKFQVYFEERHQSVYFSPPSPEDVFGEAAPSGFVVLYSDDSEPEYAQHHATTRLDLSRLYMNAIVLHTILDFLPINAQMWMYEAHDWFREVILGRANNLGGHMRQSVIDLIITTLFRVPRVGGWELRQEALAARNKLLELLFDAQEMGNDHLYLTLRKLLHEVVARRSLEQYCKVLKSI